MTFIKTTESPSNHVNLESMQTMELLMAMNEEDMCVPKAIQTVLPSIKKLVERTWPKMKEGGRLFYIGAGTSGRLGILDASECPPTYGVPPDMVIGLIAGGDTAIRNAVEFAEDDSEAAWKDLSAYDIDSRDTVVGIAASGTTPYVIGGLARCRAEGITTACITCNAGSPVAAEADIPIVAVVGPEFITGSTRMKSGTAQKLILNMISTSIMIKLGRVKGNRMVDMQLSNVKLVDRGTRMVMEATGLAYEVAEQLLKEQGSVRAAVDQHLSQA